MMHAIDCDHETEIRKQFGHPPQQGCLRLEARLKYKSFPKKFGWLIYDAQDCYDTITIDLPSFDSLRKKHAPLATF